MGIRKEKGIWSSNRKRAWSATIAAPKPTWSIEGFESVQDVIKKMKKEKKKVVCKSCGKEIEAGKIHREPACVRTLRVRGGHDP